MNDLHCPSHAHRKGIVAHSIVKSPFFMEEARAQSLAMPTASGWQFLCVIQGIFRYNTLEAGERNHEKCPGHLSRVV